jgi:dihydropteroate synthase
MSEPRATAAARGLDPVVLLLDDLTPAERDSTAAAAQLQGIECITGADWILLSGSTSGLASLGRSGADRVPQPILHSIGSCLHEMVQTPDHWVTERGRIDLTRPALVGVLNVTPDSFSDGGAYLEPQAAVARAAELIAGGAKLLDVGAESTRPGRPQPVPVTEEWRRLEPVLAEVTRNHPETPVSVDTVKAETAARALDAGAWIINDVSGLRFDARLAEVCAARGAGLILMHSRGSFSEIATYDHADYRDVVGETLRELDRSVAAAEDAGVERDRIVLDPGLGFAKRPDHNYEILKRIGALASHGFPVMIGPSRKRFLGAVTGKDASDRDAATAAVCAAAYFEGVRLFRVHAVELVSEVMDIVSAIEEA